jgi:hypothetical protein
MAGGIALVLLDRQNRAWLPFVVATAGSAALGLALGLAARRSLPHRSAFVRWLVAMGGLMVGLCLAGLLSGGRLGLGAVLPVAPVFRWGELLQLIAGGLGAWLAVRAFPRRVVPPSEPEPDSPPRSWGFTYQHHPTIYDTQPIPSRRAARAQQAAVARRLSAVRPSAERRVSPLRQRLDRIVARLSAAAAWRPTFRWLPSSRRASPIHFTGAAEDRCPYCLDVVEEHDRRGVMTCPVCHTRHHAECWAVTGTCQMPHLYAESSHRPGAVR